MPRSTKMPDGGKLPKYIRRQTLPIEQPDFITGELIPFAGQLQWMKGYVNSPKYKQRLSKFRNNINDVVDARNRRLDDIGFIHTTTQTPDDPGVYSSMTNSIRMNPVYSRSFGFEPESTKLHEISHAVNSGNSTFTSLTPLEEEYIMDKQVTFGKNRNEHMKKFARDNKISLSQAVTHNWGLHDYAPAEIKSDIDAVRYLMSREGIYDAGTQDINEDILNKARSHPRIKDASLFKRLQSKYDDKDLIDIMNKVASNNKVSSAVARNGITLGKNNKMPTGGKVGPGLPSTIKAPKKRNINDFVNQFLTNFSSPDVTLVSPNQTPSQKLYALQAEADNLFMSKPANLYGKEDPIRLTTGKMRGATPSKKLIKDIAAAADAEGIDRNTLLGLAAQESMFGSGYSAGRREVPVGSSAKSVVSGWDLDTPYRPTDLKKFLKDKGVPGIDLVKTKTGYLYTNAPNVTNEQLNRSIDSMAQVHPELIEQYAQANSNVIPSADVDYFREAAKFIKTKGLNKYNPGDPDYPNKVANSINLVKKDPNLQNYLRSFEKGGTIYSKLRHAAFGDSLEPIYYNNPYQVNNQLQNPIPYDPYRPEYGRSQDIQQGLNNISKYFANESPNMVPNNASMQGPAFDQPEYLLNAKTGKVKQSDYEPMGGGPSIQKGGNKYGIPSIRFNTAGPIMALAGLVNASTQEQEAAEEYARQARRNSMVQGYNPNPYGNGSQIIFANGGQLRPYGTKRAFKPIKK
jgi:hypothetical protein